MSALAPTKNRVWKLPPLILHPFSDASGPNKLVESSRASLMLQGLVPNDQFTVDQLDRKLLDGRFCEIRMLFYVGRDLQRWIDQCLEVLQREPTLEKGGIEGQSLSAMLVDEPPDAVRQKLQKWGVADYKAIFSRALGLNVMFAEAPAREALTDDFIRNYYRFADQMFACRQSLRSFTRISSANFDFELYASGEYSKLLEREWSEGAFEPE